VVSFEELSTSISNRDHCLMGHLMTMLQPRNSLTSNEIKEKLWNKKFWWEKRHLPHRKLHHVIHSLGIQRSQPENLLFLFRSFVDLLISSRQQPDYTSHDVTLAVLLHITSIIRYHLLTHKSEQVRVFKETKNNEWETSRSGCTRQDRSTCTYLLAQIYLHISTCTYLLA
jgi:hypothetical protein